MSAAEIYAKQLSKKKEGYPLWQPDPGANPAVEIADVGYIFRGAFVRLFNASKNRGDPSNIHGVPAQYHPLQVGPIQRNTPLPSGPIRSESVTGNSVGIDLAGGPLVQVGGGFSFSCEAQEGAILILGDFAYRQDALSLQRFLKYIRAHHTSWLAFANNDHDRGIALEDLILVTGCDKTSAWACAAFSGRSHDSSISFRAGQDIAAASFVWGRWEESRAVVDKHSGPQMLIPPGLQPPPIAEHPEPAAPPQPSQCVLLRGYRICDRKTFLMRKLRIIQAIDDGLEYVSPNLRSASKPSQTLHNSAEDATSTSRGEEFPANSEQLWFARDSENDEDLALSGSTRASKPVEPSDWAISIGPDPTGVLGKEESEIDVFLQLNYGKERALLHHLLYYIFANSDAQLAIVHDDDLSTLIQDDTDIDDFERWICKLAPEIRVVDEVGMLKTTYRHWPDLDMPSEPPFMNYGLPDLTGQVERFDEYPYVNGGHADIYLGEWVRSGESQKVVVRVLRSTSTSKTHQRQRDFLSEWYKFIHPNILPLYGICTDFSTLPAAISPWMAYGNVVKYIMDHGSSCTLSRRLSLLSDLSSALKYLHNHDPEIIHGDLKGDNVFISENFGAVLGGFKNSRTSEYEDQEASDPPAASVRWMAPELLTGDDCPGLRRFSAMSDVYAFGGLIIQIISSRAPWFNIISDASVPLLVINGQNPPVPDDTYLPPEIKDIMEDCWAHHATSRPSMDAVASLLSTWAMKLGDAIVPPAYSEDSSRIQPTSEQPITSPSTPPPPFIQTLTEQSSTSGTLASARAPPLEVTEETTKGKKRELSPSSLLKLGAEEFIAELRPVAALAPILNLIQQIIKACDNMRSNRDAAKQLQERCRYMILTLSDQSTSIGLEEAEVMEFVVLLDEILLVILRFTQYNRWESFLHLQEISDGIRECHVKIDDCCREFQNRSHTHLYRWHSEFDIAHQKDKAELIETLIKLEDDDAGTHWMLEKTGAEFATLLELLQKYLGESELDSVQYHALEESLYRTQKIELPPNINLKAGEARRVGRFPVGGNAAFDIWKGIWLGNKRVALKTIRGVHVSPKAHKRFEVEVKIWRKLWNLDHGCYILPFYGACFEDGPYPYLVSPWMSNGDVVRYLTRNPDTNRLDIIKGIARGLSLLHNLKPMPIAHGDVKAANVLIDDNGRPLLADFGLSKILEDITGVPFTQSKGVSESYRWFAPELCTTPGVISTCSDIFAYAMTVVEIMTGKPPFSHIKRTTEVLIEMQKGERPRRPTDELIESRGLDDHLWDILTQCWKEQPSDRLTINEVLAEL